MEMTPQRNAEGDVIRRPVQPILPPALGAHPTNQQVQAFYAAYQAAVQAAAAAEGPPENYRPTDAQLKEYLLAACKRSRIGKYYQISDEAVLNRNLAWTFREIRMDILNLADKDATEKSGRGKRAYSPSNSGAALVSSGRDSHHSGVRGDYHVGDDDNERRAYFGRRRSPSFTSRGERGTSRSRSRERQAFAAEQAHSSKSRSSHSPDTNHNARNSYNVSFESNNKLKCYNCGGDHVVSNCTSRACGICGGRFATAGDRKKHYMATHRGGQSSDNRNHTGYSSREGRGRSPSPYRAQRSGSRGRSPGRTPMHKSYSAEFYGEEEDGAGYPGQYEDSN
mmetsp:Transcript_5125/g.7158  ORF Transcript_5125/g.7158 Transcript_5125/m.7158 type:complete len:337 (-) Transcript_5125:789-1799(-)